MGIDSSTPLSSVAVLKDGHIIDQAELLKNSTFSNQVLVLVDKILARSNIKLNDLDGLCLTIGPGSFTGLRVGVSLLKGLIMATSKPFVTIDTLEATALMAMPTNNKICAILDAKKKELYTAFFQATNNKVKRLTPDRAITSEQLCDEILEPTIFVGNGLDSYSEFLANRLGKNFLPKHNLTTTVAACAARIAEEQFDTNKRFDLNKLIIKYVRKSEAEIKLSEQGCKKGVLDYGN